MRTRAILLTSLAAMLGAWPITLDPIFSGLAWALIFGLLVSTLFTLVVVPMIYYMAYEKRRQEIGVTLSAKRPPLVSLLSRSRGNPVHATCGL